MEQIYKFIIDKINEGTMSREVAVPLLKQLKKEEERGRANRPGDNRDIAVVGLSLRLPNAGSTDEFWCNLTAGADCIRGLPPSRQADVNRFLRFLDKREEDIAYNANAYLDQVDKFDNSFFRMSPKEAALTDPNHRMFLETAWEAIEHAGYGGGKLAGSRTGVYLGLSNNIRDLYARFIYDGEPQSFAFSLVGNLAAVATGRLSYLLDLRGPSLVVDTSCSSSLVSITLACQALREGQCDQAVVGGIKLNLVPVRSEHIKIGIESTDARTKAFDDDSDGSGIGEGVGVVVLKPLKKALRDNDQIHAVIKGYAVTQDGKSISIAAPNPDAQTETILRAWEDANVDPETISYIETHGSGTRIGDPLEVQGIENAFRKHTEKKQFCGIGSVKTNIGHTSEAAGVVGLIKAILSLKARKLPASLHFHRPNRSISFCESPVYVNTRLRDWTTPEGTPRRCGVSAFGISGTNCHVVLEEAPEASAAPALAGGERTQALVISGKSEGVLLELVLRYRDFLRDEQGTSFPSICYTANTGRGHYHYRLALLADDRNELLRKLELLTAVSEWGAAGAGIHYGYHKPVDGTKQMRDEGELTEKEKRLLGEGSEELLSQYRETGSQEALNGLCEMYVRGFDLDWERLYPDSKPGKVAVPTYPFARNRCWLQLPEGGVCEEHEEEASAPLYYGITWQPEPLLEEISRSRTGTILVLFDKDGLGERLAAHYESAGREVVRASYGDDFRQDGPGTFTVSGSEEDFIALLSAFDSNRLTQIIHAFAYGRSSEAGDDAGLRESQERGVYSLYHLTRALFVSGKDQDIALTLLSDSVYEVTSTETRLQPEAASLHGLGKSLPLEYPQLSCRCIDIEGDPPVELLAREIDAEDRTYAVAYRDGVRYVEELRELEIGAIEATPVAIRQGGAYLITGGLGGIGLEIAKFFASFHPVKLGLVSRTPMPSRERWEALLDDTSTDAKTAHRIRMIMEIESGGSEVVCYSADVSLPEETERVVRDFRDRYGGIHGIVHGAGMPGIGFLVRKTREAFDGVLRTKVWGARNLDAATASDNLDFFVLFSSGLALSSEAGQGDYSAANLYLDAFAIERSRRAGKTLSINWSSWKEAGMSVEYGFNVDAITMALPTAHATAGMLEALNRRMSRVLIGRFTYSPRFAATMLNKFPFRFSAEMTTRLEAALKQAANQQTARPTAKISGGGTVELKGKEGREFTEIERKIAGMYNEVLGFDEIDVYDSFFDLGGDSILLNRLYALLEDTYPGKVKLIHLFSHTSVAALSKYIAGKDSKTTKGEKDDDKERELDQYASMFKEIEQGTLNIDDAIKSFSNL